MDENRPTAPLILIEGLDFSGKSTVARILVERLAARGGLVEHSTSSLLQGPLLRLAVWVGNARPAIRRWRPVVYAALPVADRLFFRSRPGAVRVHEGSIDRMIAFQTVFGSARTARVLRALRPHLIEFDLTVLLTAGHRVRAARSRSRSRINDVDRKILADAGLLARCDGVLTELAASRRRAVVIDTSELDVDEVVARILTAIPADWLPTEAEAPKNEVI